MKSTDKFLIGIVAGIVLLIVIALVVTLTKPEPTYQAEDNPEGITHNYILALQKEDFERAYGYLSPSLPGYPDTLEEFSRIVHKYSYRFRLSTNSTIAVEESSITGAYADVRVSLSRFRSGDIFDSGLYTYTRKMELRLENGEWKIVEGSSFFVSCWNKDEGCD